MNNKYENCPAEEFIKLCFADDALWYDRKNKKEYRFWDNFEKIDIKNWKENDLKIYDTSKYETLPDPDATSKKLYEAHNRVWNEQCENFNIPKVSLNKNCELKINEKEIYLGSDSIMSIYWHWAGKQYPYKDMQDIINRISDENTGEYKNLCNEYRNLYEEISKNFLDTENLRHNPDRKVTDILKKFIWCYLQKANTIGGFVLFPRHSSSINSMRGCNSKIRDRFDLTLECIRRAYQYRDFYREDNNPLFGLSEEDKEFFRMFGSFENYTKFFCLDKSWVKEGKVLNLLNNEPLEEWDFNQQEPLPQNSEEWWTFYHNIMNRLDARNQQIKEIIERK